MNPELWCLEHFYTIIVIIKNLELHYFLVKVVSDLADFFYSGFYDMCSAVSQGVTSVYLLIIYIIV